MDIHARDRCRIWHRLPNPGGAEGRRAAPRNETAFGEAFGQFDMYTVADYNQIDVDLLLANTGIVRHRCKIEAVLHNARNAIELQTKFGSLSAFVWRYEPAPDELDTPQSASTPTLT